MIVLADMMDRPPLGAADVYLGAYLAGFLVLCAVAWLVARRFLRPAGRAAFLVAVALFAIVAGLALREDYHVSRAESCFRFLQDAAERGNQYGALTAYGRGGGWLVRIGPGYIRTKYGTPPELVAYLKRKYSGWFSGTIVALRNRIFGLTLPRADELAKVANMPVPPPPGTR